MDWKKGPDWDVHDVYDWLPGMTSGEEQARSRKLADMRGRLPKAGPAWTPEMSEAFAQASSILSRPLGQGWEQGAHYQQLAGKVEDLMRRRGWEAGGDLAARGMRTTGAYGPGRRTARRQTYEEGRLLQGAQAQAQRAAVADDMARVRGLLRQAGFAQGVHDADFRHQYQSFLAGMGLTQAEIDLEIERMERWWETAVGGVQTGIGALEAITAML